MTEVLSVSLQDLKEQIENLIQFSAQQQQTIQQLTQENQAIKQEIRLAHADIVELQKKYDRLKVAQATVQLTKGDAKLAQKRLSEMMNKINICIAQLSK